jgi:tRNA(Ile)-lysidine synthase
MEELFLDYLKNNSLLNRKILLAVSGGVDSMVMVHLFLRAKVNIGVAHCNFQLRGGDALEDENLVVRETEKQDIPSHVIRFKTVSYAKKHGLSIQMAARELRYNWFEQICKLHNYSFIATAHHQDDSIETFLLNLLRPTGIAGLHGINDIPPNIIRPIIFADKEQIRTYAKEHNILYREDISNASDHYQRNYIRHRIIPQFKELNPNFTKILQKSIEIISKQEIVYKEHIHQTLKSCVIKDEDEYVVEIDKIKQLYPLDVYLFELLHSFGYNYTHVKDLIQCMETKEEKMFISPSCRLLKTRDRLIIIPVLEEETPFFILDELDKDLFFSAGLTMEIKERCDDFLFENNPNIAYFDLDRLSFPLQIRDWRYGDYFYPFGGKGKKKLSDFFSDMKFNSIEKHTTKLLCDGNEDILWIIGLRSDNRYRVKKSTRRILVLKSRFSI